MSSADCFLTLVALLAMILPAGDFSPCRRWHSGEVGGGGSNRGKDTSLTPRFQDHASTMAEHALEKGIVLYFVTELNLVSSRWYWLDERVAQSRVREGLSYYALTRQYRLSRGTFFTELRYPQGGSASTKSRTGPSDHSQHRAQARYGIRGGSAYASGYSGVAQTFQVETLGSRDWDLSTGMLRWNKRLPSSKESQKSAVESGTDKIGTSTVHHEGLGSGTQPECGRTGSALWAARFPGLRQAGLARRGGFRAWGQEPGACRLARIPLGETAPRPGTFQRFRMVTDCTKP